MKTKESHIEDLKEWQEKQYLPGYYVGGKIHPILKQRTKGLAIGLLVLGGFFFLFGLGFVLFGGTGESWLNAGWNMGVGLLFTAAGIAVARQIGRTHRKTSSKK